jgi:hypothetical protein
MAFGRKVQDVNRTGGNNPNRTTSYPQGQEGKAPVVGTKRTTSYKSALQFDARGYETIN